MLKQSILETIGDTPLIRLSNIEKKYGLDFHLFAKVERFNPSGSTKDRAALYIIKRAMDQGLIRNSTEIIEATSGNTGISLAMICAYYGNKCTIIMPSNASKERAQIMKAYGANVILTDAALGMKGSVDLANKLHEDNQDSFVADQFNNPANIEAHFETTANEIINDLDGNVDFFIAGFGTSGTLSGTSKRLKEYNPKIKCYGVMPLNSSLFEEEGKTSDPHKIQGIGPNFIPGNFKKEYINGLIKVSDDDAYEGTRALAREEGIFAGISSGACLMGAIKAQGIEFKGKNVVIVLPDNGERYLSVEGLYE